MFCNKCGSEVSEGEEFCSNCGAPMRPAAGGNGGKKAAKAKAVKAPKAPKAPKKKSKTPLIIAVASLVTLMIAAVLVVLGINLVKTKDFTEVVETFAAVEKDCEGLGEYADAYQELLDDAQSAASGIAFWRYADMTEEMESLEKEIREMNRAVAKYRDRYDACVEQIEADGKYVLGSREAEYAETKKKLEDALADYDEKNCKKNVDNLEQLCDEIVEMNNTVAEYRQKYEECLERIEGGRYVLGDLETGYTSTKSAMEEALANFDADQCRRNATDLEGFCTEIVESNERMAVQAVEEVSSIRSSYAGMAAYSFEQYIIGDYTSKVEQDQINGDYVQLQEDYEALKKWSDKLSIISNMPNSRQVTKFSQADVSDRDNVKIYFTPADYDTYNFKLEDFVIYERDGGVWNECKAIDISQIQGMLTMDLVVDVSSSMSYQFYDMQCAVEGFVNSVDPDTALGLATIGSIYQRYHNFTQDKNAIITSAWNLECYGLTSLYQSLYSSVVYTASSEGARCVVAFTDGHNEPYGSGFDYSAQDVIDVSLMYQVPVYIIGIGSGVYSSELRQIAESTGGMYYDRISIRDLQNVYSDIYAAQGRTYQLTYSTTVSNSVNRDLYLLYADDSYGLSLRMEEPVNAQVLQAAYETGSFNANDLCSFYTDAKYLSSDNLAALGDNLEAVQTIINIYYSKNGYRFSDGENGQKQLAKMLSLGVITQNGTLDGDTVSALIKNNAVLYQNFSALYNYRYELIYRVAHDIYINNPNISYEDLRFYVHQHYGEANEKRFDPVTKAAWKALHSN